MLHSSSDNPQHFVAVEQTDSALRYRAKLSAADAAGWGILIFATLIFSLMTFVLYGDDAWDDAYISFRYSRNLANGDGLVWNPGGEHTQGYTNFLFVVLVAGGMKLGIPPLLTANVLNMAGLLGIILTLGTLSRALLSAHRRAWILPPLALLFLPAIALNMTTRMETVFWSGLLLIAILAAERAVHTGQTACIYSSLFLLFLATFTRPETVIIAALVGLYLLFNMPGRGRIHILISGGIVGIAGLAYLYWANGYFGDFLPNPYYLKVNQPGTLPGLNYVIEVPRYFAALPMTYPGLVGLLMIPRRHWAALLPYASVFAIAIFYLFASPLMGYGFRFVFPVVILIDFLLATGLVTLILQMHGILLKHSALHRRSILRVAALVTLAVMLAFLVLHFWIGSYFIWYETHLEERPQAFTSQGKIGLLLRDIDGIEDMTVAFNDAGKIAYYSNSKFLDLVGLNENTIARVGNQRGADWVIRYVLDQQPDLIGFFVYADGKVHRHDHGALASNYYALYTHPEFMDFYTYAGGFDSHWTGYAQFFVRSGSPYAAVLMDTLRNHAEITELGTLHP